MPVQKDIEEGIPTLSSNVENNDTTSDNIDTINNSEASIESSISSPIGATSATHYGGNVSHTLPPPPEDTDQSTIIANHLQNTSYGHNETEQGYTQSQPSSGLVQIHDDNIAPLPPIAALDSIPDSSSMAAKSKTMQGKIEQIEDSTAPSLPATAFDDSDIKRKIAQETTRIDTINDKEEDAPVPFNMSNLAIEEDAKIKCRHLNPQSGRDEIRGRDSLAIPTSDDLESDTEQYTTLTTPSTLMSRRDNTDRVRGIVGGEDAVEYTITKDEDSSSLVEEDRDTYQSTAIVNRAHNETMPTALEQERSDSIPIIPEAFLVEESEDGIVFDAEPWLPWWKRKRFVGFLLLFAACVLAISIGVGTFFGRQSQPTDSGNVILSIESYPSISPAPSTSLAPSSAPSKCVNQIMTSNMQKIDLQNHLLVDPRDVKVAVDGRNMVVVAKDTKYCRSISCSSYDGPVYVTFYSLDNDDEWQRVSAPFRVDDMGSSYSLAMSEETVLVGFPYANDGAGDVHVYKKNLFGGWDRVENPFIRNTTRIGGSIDIDGDLASVVDNNWYNKKRRAHLFHRSGDKWVQSKSFAIGFDRGYKSCSIAGDIIVLRNSTDEGFHKLQLYKYDMDLNEAIAIQDPIVTGDGYIERQCFSSDGTNYTSSYVNKLPRAISCERHDFSLVSSLELSKDYLVFRKQYTHDGIFIYHRDETNQTCEKRKIAQETTRIDTINDKEEDAPVPFNMSNLAIEEDAKIKCRHLNPQSGRDEIRGRDSLAIPTSDDLESDTEQYTTLTTPSTLMSRRDNTDRVRGIVGGEDAVEYTITKDEDSSSLVEEDRDTYQSTAIVNRAHNETMPTALEQERSDSIPIIPEAFLVEESEDGIVFDAEPWLPWWKRKRFVGFLLLFAACVLAISIGVGTFFGRQSQPTDSGNVILSIESYPSISPAPSTSLAPSSAPSKCVNQIMTSNMQKIDLQNHLLVDPRDVKVAVDGRNMVVVAKDTKYCRSISCSSYDGPVYVTFYSLDNDDEWQRVSAPFRVDDMGSSYSLAMSEETVLVGFPYANDGAGDVHVYKKNLFGGWDRVENPFIRNTTRIGGSIDIDGDLASVVDNNWYNKKRRAHLFHRSGDKWVQSKSFAIGFDRGYKSCSIAGDIIVLRNSTDEGFHKLQLYKYDMDLNEAIAIQDPIVTGDGYIERQCFSSDGTNYTSSYVNKLPRAISCERHDFSLVSSLELSKDYLVFRKQYTHDGIFIYHRDETNQTFTFHQQLNINITGPSDNSLAIDNDILVVGGDNQTYIYSLQDGDWVESITLAQSFDHYQLSGRNIIATNSDESGADEIYSFHIQDCVQEMPTQTPSVSRAPSTSPSFLPSMSQVPSILPSSTSSPTVTCYWIEVAIDPGVAMDDSWGLYRVVDDSDDKEEVKSHSYTAGDKEWTCLQEGKYEFIIHGSVNPRLGDCDFKEGDYIITTLDGTTIEGQNVFEEIGRVVGRCDFQESTYFSMPYAIAPSMEPSTSPSSHPTVSSAPTYRYMPSLSPSVSFSPTNTCYWVDIAVVFDDYPEETSWQLQKMNDSGDYIVLNSFNGTSDDATQLQKESMCLEGEQTYQFTIYDSAGDGIFSPGHYNVTSNGNLIVQGGEFENGEITSFSIPFVPGSSTLTNVTQEPTTYPPQTPRPQTPFPAYPPQTPFPTEPIEPTVSPRPQTPFPTEGVLLLSSASVVAVDDIINLTQGTTEAFVAVLENDSGSNLIVRAITSQPTNGQCSISFNLLEVVYFPNNTTFVGSDQCTYETCDDKENCDTAVVQINIGNNQVSTLSPTRSPSLPVASPDSANLSTSEDNMIFVSVLDNDTPTAGQTLSINSITSQALNGDCSISIDLLEVVYFPNPGFTGFDTCVYEACDSVPACDTATLTVIVMGT